MKLITILIPVLNEENNLLLTKSSLEDNTKNLLSSYLFEFIILDNASTDNTSYIAKKICLNSSNWKYIRYSRNFGYHNSLSGGIENSNGDALIFFQGDGQEPAEEIPNIIKKWEEGYDVVYGIINKRNDDSVLKNFFSGFFYKILSATSESPMPKKATDFRLINRKVIDNIKKFKEQNRYIRGLIHWIGFKQTHFFYDRKKRAHDKSKADFFYSLNFGANAIASFSSAPVYLLLYLGIIIILSSILISLYFFISYFIDLNWFTKKPPVGITTIIILILTSIGVNTLFLGVVGLYISKIYKETQNRPLYIIDEKINF